MSIFGDLKQKITRYADVYIKLLKINFIGRSANVFSYFLFALICLFFFFCIILFIGFGLSEVFVEAGLSKMVSFFIVVGIYFLLLFVVMALRKKIIRFFASGFIRVLTEGDDEEQSGEEIE